MTLFARAKGGDMLSTWCDRGIIAQNIVQAVERIAGDFGLSVADN